MNNESRELSRVYIHSALIYAAVAAFGSLASILVIFAGAFAVWTLHIHRRIPVSNVDELKILWLGVLGYYGAGVLSTIQNPSDVKTIAQLIERMPYLFLPVLVQLLVLVNGRKLLQFCAVGACVGVSAALIYSAIKFQSFQIRLELLNGNPNILGYASSVLLIVFSAGLIGLNDTKVRIACLAAIPGAFLIIVLSGSRAALLAGLTACVIIVAYSLLWRSIRARIALAVGAVAVVSAALVLTPAGDRFVDAAKLVTSGDIDRQSNDGQRLAIWSCGIAIAGDVPALGRGQDQALSELSACLNEELERDLNFTHFHNIFIDQYAKGGFVGLIGVLLLILAPLVLFLLYRRKLSSGHGLLGRVVLAAIFSLWCVQMIAGLLNIGIGHDIVDTLYIYTLALFVGIAHTLDQETVE